MPLITPSLVIRSVNSKPREQWRDTQRRATGVGGLWGDLSLLPVAVAVDLAVQLSTLGISADRGGHGLAPRSQYDFAVTRFLMKMFRTVNTGVINDCRLYFDFMLPSELLVKRKSNFLRKFSSCSSIVSHFGFQKCV